MPRNNQIPQPQMGGFHANVKEMLDGLKQELALITETIRSLEALAEGRSPGGAPPRRRGRPPGSKNKPRPL